MTLDYPATRKLLLLRYGALYLEPSATLLPEKFVQGFEVNMADAGYAIASALRVRLQTLDTVTLGALQAWAGAALLEKVGGNRKFTPLFRRFPEDVPINTFDLWQRRVLSHFMQAEGQPCLHCERNGTTHVLNPCRHVVCDACFDGGSYSACPICGHHVDRNSAFFVPDQDPKLPRENVKLKLLHLGASLHDGARELFLSMCARKQAMSPVDKDDFLAIITEFGPRALSWLP